MYVYVQWNLYNEVARFLWSRSRPQTTGHVVLFRPGDDQRVKKISCESRNGAGAVRDRARE